MITKRCTEVACRSRAVVDGGISRIFHTATCPRNPRNNRPPRLGEYVVRVRSKWDEEPWRDSLDFDPVPDHNDLTTESDLHNLRSAIADLAGDPHRSYRIVYVPD